MLVFFKGGLNSCLGGKDLNVCRNTFNLDKAKILIRYGQCKSFCGRTDKRMGQKLYAPDLSILGTNEIAMCTLISDPLTLSGCFSIYGRKLSTAYQCPYSPTTPNNIFSLVLHVFL